MKNRWRGLLGLALGAAIMAGGALGASAPPGALDNGNDLLPEANVTFAEAILYATSAASGDTGEINFAQFQGILFFNVDDGDQDVNVDANTVAVLASGTDQSLG